METNQLLLHPDPASGVPTRTDIVSPSSRSALTYLEAAGALLEHWKAHPREELVSPIFDTYRASAQIAVKDAIRLAARCLRSDGARGADVDPGILEARLSTSDKLVTLVRQFAALYRRIPFGSSDPSAHSLEVLESLYALDSPTEGALVVRRGSAGGRSLVRAGAGVRRDADLEAVSVLLTDAVMFLAHEVCGALVRFVAVRGEASAT